MAEVFARLKERRWSGQIMVHARGVTDGWKPIEEVAEFAPLLKQLRGTYMGASSELQWRASVDASERGVEHTVWTPQEPDSSDSHPSNGPSWHSHAVDVQEDSFGFLSPSAPPPQCDTTGIGRIPARIFVDRITPRNPGDGDSSGSHPAPNRPAGPAKRCGMLHPCSFDPV